MKTPPARGIRCSEAEAELGWGEAEDYADLFAGGGRAEARLPRVERLLRAMERQRPADAPYIHDRWGGGALEEVQLASVAQRVPEWWLVIPPEPGEPDTDWRYHQDGG